MTVKLNYLFPGYTEQGFSYARSSLYQSAAWLKEKQNIAGTISLPFVYAAKVGITLIELPIKLIEEVVLTIINLIGALFNKTCQRHFHACLIPLGLDVFKCFLIICIATPLLYPLVPTLGPGFFFGVSFGGLGGWIGVEFHELLDIFKSPEKTADFHLIPFYRIQAIRIHGYKKVSVFEELLHLNHRALKRRHPSDILFFYKKLVQGNPNECRSFLKSTLEQERERTQATIDMTLWSAAHKTQNDIPVEENAKQTFGEEMIKTAARKFSPRDLNSIFSDLAKTWECPQNLIHDSSETATVIKRILRLSENIDPKTMNQEQVTSYLNNLLALSPSHTFYEAWTEIHLLLHPEKNAGTPYETYAKEAREALDEALSVSEMITEGIFFLDYKEPANPD